MTLRVLRPTDPVEPMIDTRFIAAIRAIADPGIVERVAISIICVSRWDGARLDLVLCIDKKIYKDLGIGLIVSYAALVQFLRNRHLQEVTHHRLITLSVGRQGRKIAKRLYLREIDVRIHV